MSRVPMTVTRAADSGPSAVKALNPTTTMAAIVTKRTAGLRKLKMFRASISTAVAPFASRTWPRNSGLKLFRPGRRNANEASPTVPTNGSCDVRPPQRTIALSGATTVASRFAISAGPSGTEKEAVLGVVMTQSCVACGDSAARHARCTVGDRADRFLDLERGARPARDDPSRPTCGAGGLSVRSDLGPLPSMDRPAGPEPIRLVGHRRHRGDDEAHGRHGGNVPDHPDPPGGRRSSCGDIIRDARWSFLPGCRHRREPERACRRSRLAATRDAPRDARGGDRSPAPSLPRRRAELPRYVLHRRGRAPLN